MTEPKHITFDLDHVLEILRKGVRRADVFMGIGLNSSGAEPPISHTLVPDRLHQITLVKQDLTPEEQAHVAAEFGKWIRANGLRELTETLALFLDHLYMPLFAISGGASSTGKKLVAPDRFERLGLTEKLDAMTLLVAVSDHDRRSLYSLNRIRNCYAHRLGVVGQRDLDSAGGAMTVVWLAFEMQVQEPDGNIIPEDELCGRVIENGGSVYLNAVTRNRIFPEGVELVLEKRDLKEICLSVLIIGQRLLHATAESARAAGRLIEAVDGNLDQPEPV